MADTLDFRTIGRATKGNARGSGYKRHETDWYQESAAAADAVIAAEGFDGPVWDPAAGGGNIPRRCAAAGIEAVGSDIVDRGAGFPVMDFVSALDRDRVASYARVNAVSCIFSNPPFKLAVPFVERALELVPGKVCVMQRLAWLEGKERRKFFERTHLSHVWVHSGRVSMPPGGMDVEAKGGSVAYAWFVWRPGRLGPWTGGFL
jgi:hypothetical protein